ncbi:MAG: YihY/virulence factor BrkB family protein [Sporolactobacillus sp.]
MGKKRCRYAFDITRLFVKQFMTDQTTDLAATLAYFFLLSLFPLAIFVFALVPYTGLPERELFRFISQFMPAEVVTLLRDNLPEILKKSGSLVSVGALATLWSASNALNALIRALNHAYRVKETRSFVHTRLLSIGLTLLMVAAIVISLVINVVLAGLTQLLFKFIGLDDPFISLWWFISVPVSFLLIFAIFSCLYKLAPSTLLRWREVYVGAALAAAGWQVASYAFSVYVRYFGHYSATYGTLGAIIILMLWFYLSAIMVLTGGQINAIIRRLLARRDH